MYDLDENQAGLCSAALSFLERQENHQKFLDYLASKGWTDDVDFATLKNMETTRNALEYPDWMVF